MVNDLLVSLGHTTVASSLAAVLVLVVRLPLRRTFGCGVAYAAWLAVPLTALATMLPRPAFQVPALGMTRITHLVVDAAPGIAAEPTTWNWQYLIAFLWACGAIVMALLHARAQRAYIRSLGPLMVDGGIAISRSPNAGPSLVGLWRPVIVVPSDFDQRYTRVQRELILAHERAHAEAGDPLVNLLCAGCLCVWWFNPLMHLAARLLREEQELARDADVMHAFPGNRRAYADAMLKTQLTSPFHSTIACRWEPKHPLKERLMSLSRSPSNPARWIGRSMVVLGLSCGAYAAWAEQGVAKQAMPEAKRAVAAPVDSPAAQMADWERAIPQSTVSVTPGPLENQFLFSTRIVDLRTSKVLSAPRILTRAGFPATMETGDDQLMVRIVVTVYPSGRKAAYTLEVLRDRVIESKQSAILTIDANGFSQPTTTPMPDARDAGGRS